MKLYKEHIIFKTLALCLALIVLAPVAVKFGHAFSHHNHKVCLDNSTTHFHEFDVDCNFYKFKLNTPFYLSLKNFELYHEVFSFKIGTNLYTFLNNHRRLSFSLRGPPVLV